MVKKILSTLTGNVLFALPVAILLTVLLFLAVARFDALIDAALFLPRKLGLTAELSPDEIIELNTSDKNIVYLEEGRYHIYSNRQLAREADLSLLSQENFSRTNAPSLYRSIPIAANKPQFFFTIEETGDYEVIISGGSRADDIPFTIEPYYGNQNAFIALISGILQIAIIVFGIRLVKSYLNKDKIKALTDSQAQKRDAWDSVLDDLKKKER